MQFDGSCVVSLVRVGSGRCLLPFALVALLVAPADVVGLAESIDDLAAGFVAVLIPALIIDLF